MAQSKTQRIKDHLAANEVIKALKIAKGFWTGWTDAEKRDIDIAVEAANGNGKFYADLGIDTDDCYQRAEAFIRAKFQPLTSSCAVNCDQGDWRPGGKCDKEGCYYGKVITANTEHKDQEIDLRTLLRPFE